jgi:hypothetical protein
MDAIVSVSDRLDIKAQAWRISFSESPPENQTVFMTVGEPQKLVATALSIEVADALADSAAVEAVESKPSWWRRSGKSSRARKEKPLLLIWVPSDAANSGDIERHIKTMWPAEGQGSKQPLVRAGIRTSRVFCSDDRAIIFAAAEQSMDAIDAVLRFTVAARQTLILEQQMSELWSSIDTHKSLVHDVRTRDQRLQKAVNAMTERATVMRSMFLRLTKTLEQLDPTLNSASKRLYAELVLQGSLYDRLEMIEDPIQFALDHYELANTRLIEARSTARQIRLEVLVCVLLASELVAFLLSLLWRMA